MYRKNDTRAFLQFAHGQKNVASIWKNSFPNPRCIQKLEIICCDEKEFQMRIRV
jgi:hypothetical protein